LWIVIIFNDILGTNFIGFGRPWLRSSPIGGSSVFILFTGSVSDSDVDIIAVDHIKYAFDAVVSKNLDLIFVSENSTLACKVAKITLLLSPKVRLRVEKFDCTSQVM